MLNSLTNNKYAVKESFPFTKETVEQGSGSFMESLDVDFFLLPLYLKRILTFVTKTCWKTERGEGLSKTEFKELLSVATKESYFIFNGKFNKQVRSVDMGSPLSLTLTNSVLLYFEKNCSQNSSSDFKPSHYQWDVDGNLFHLPHENIWKLSKVSKWSTCHHPFTSEIKKRNRKSSLDVLIICEDKNLAFLSTRKQLLVEPIHNLRAF